MLRNTLRSLWAHKRRLVSTLVAIVLGVAFMCGTLVLSDTLDASFDDLFAEVNEGVDAELRGEELFDSSFGGAARGRIDESVLDTVRGVDGVRAAEGYVSAFGGVVLDQEGEQIGGQGPPTFLESWVPDEDISPYQLAEGRAPEATDEIVLDRRAAEEGPYELGDDVTVLTQEGRRTYTLVGIVTFGGEDSAGGAVAADFVLEEAQRLAGAEGQFDSISVAAEDGVSPEELVDRLAEVVPDRVEVVTGEQSAADMASDVQEGFGFFTQILVVFAGIALFVGSFIIYNTFSILIAQRTRELALLRALGASRRQVLSSVLAESVLVGVVAALIGLAAGVALAAGVRSLLSGLGVDLPDTSLVIGPSTIVTALVAGLGVTLVAAVAPALRATRVPPLAALRDVAVDRTGTSVLRRVLAAALIVLAILNVLPAFDAGADSGDLPAVGIGVLFALVAVIVVGPVIARPLARVLGGWLPSVRGITGRLALENAVRSPRRTSSTAAALMIGVALIGFITVFASSARASIESEVERGFRGDFVVQGSSQFMFVGAPPELSERLAGLEGIDVVAAQRFGEAQITYPGGDTSLTFVGAVQPEAFAEVLDLRMEEGEVTDLTDDGIIVDRQIAEDEELAVGDVVTVTGPAGAEVELTVQAISDDRTMLGMWTITHATNARLVPEQSDAFIALSVEDGVDPAEVRPELEALVDTYAVLEVLDRDEFVGSLADQVSQLLNLIYGLLALSIIIALIGIANTLSLSIHERTRELGLLRAVGMTRSQLRSAVRWEAVVVALLGTGLGLVLGLVASWLILQPLAAEGLTEYRVPVVSLVVVVVLGALLGVLASVRPSRRAAKLDVLDAIAEE